MRRFLATIFLAVLVVPLGAQPRPSSIDPYLTYGCLNGRGWLLTTTHSATQEIEQTTYLLGIRDAAYAEAIRNYAKTGQWVAPWFVNYRLIDLAPRGTEFYADKANLAIPVYYAWDVVGLRLSGAPQSTIDSVINQFRTASAAQGK